MRLNKSLTIAACGMALFAFAGRAESYVHIRTDAGWEVLDLDKTRSMDFNGGKVSVINTEGAVVSTFNQSELQKIYVDDSVENNESVWVETVAIDGTSDGPAFNLTSQTASMLTDGDFEVYSTDGTLLVRIPEVKAGETVNLSGIAPGVVIIKSGNQSLKAILR